MLSKELKRVIGALLKNQESDGSLSIAYMNSITDFIRAYLAILEFEKLDDSEK